MMAKGRRRGKKHRLRVEAEAFDSDTDQTTGQTLSHQYRGLQFRPGHAHGDLKRYKRKGKHQESFLKEKQEEDFMQNGD